MSEIIVGHLLTGRPSWTARRGRQADHNITADQCRVFQGLIVAALYDLDSVCSIINAPTRLRIEVLLQKFRLLTCAAYLAVQTTSCFRAVQFASFFSGKGHTGQHIFLRALHDGRHLWQLVGDPDQPLQVIVLSLQLDQAARGCRDTGRDHPLTALAGTN